MASKGRGLTKRAADVGRAQVIYCEGSTAHAANVAVRKDARNEIQHSINLGDFYNLRVLGWFDCEYLGWYSDLSVTPGLWYAPHREENKHAD